VQRATLVGPCRHGPAGNTRAAVSSGLTGAGPHTDSAGKPAYNKDLSQRRAHANNRRVEFVVIEQAPPEGRPLAFHPSGPLVFPAARWSAKSMCTVP
jgi:hypothetical protein